MMDTSKMELTETRLKEIQMMHDKMTDKEFQQILKNQKTLEILEKYFEENKWKIGRRYYNDDGSEDVYETEDLEEIGKILRLQSQ